MVNVVKTALNNEEYELLQSCEGSTDNEKLRNSVRKSISVNHNDDSVSSEPISESQFDAEKYKEAYKEGIKKGRELERESIDEEENDLRQELVNLEGQCALENRLQELFNFSDKQGLRSSRDGARTLHLLSSDQIIKNEKVLDRHLMNF